MPSDEEEIFHKESFQIDRTIISNFFNSKSNIIDYNKVPADLFEKDSMFKVTPTALNNRLVFISWNNHIGFHKPDPEGRKKFCDLAPVGNLSWKAATKISQVFIMDCDIHPKENSTVWACHHHGTASIKGVVLQTQRYDYKTPQKNVIEETISTMKDTESLDVKEKVDEKVESSMDDVEEDNDANQGVNKKRRSLNKKKKVVTKAVVVEVEVLAKKHKKEEAKK